VLKKLPNSHGERWKATSLFTAMGLAYPDYTCPYQCMENDIHFIYDYEIAATEFVLFC
jgi:hypothetical protein